MRVHANLYNRKGGMGKNFPKSRWVKKRSKKKKTMGVELIYDIPINVIKKFNQERRMSLKQR